MAADFGLDLAVPERFHDLLGPLAAFFRLGLAALAVLRGGQPFPGGGVHRAFGDAAAEGPLGLGRKALLQQLLPLLEAGVDVGDAGLELQADGVLGFQRDDRAGHLPGDLLGDASHQRARQPRASHRAHHQQIDVPLGHGGQDLLVRLALAHHHLVRNSVKVELLEELVEAGPPLCQVGLLRLLIGRPQPARQRRDHRQHGQLRLKGPRQVDHVGQGPPRGVGEIHGAEDPGHRVRRPRLDDPHRLRGQAAEARGDDAQREPIVVGLLPRADEDQVRLLRLRVFQDPLARGPGGHGRVDGPDPRGPHAPGDLLEPLGALLLEHLPGGPGIGHLGHHVQQDHSGTERLGHTRGNPCRVVGRRAEVGGHEDRFQQFHEASLSSGDLLPRGPSPGWTMGTIIRKVPRSKQEGEGPKKETGSEPQRAVVSCSQAPPGNTPPGRLCRPHPEAEPPHAAGSQAEPGNQSVHLLQFSTTSPATRLNSAVFAETRISPAATA